VFGRLNKTKFAIFCLGAVSVGPALTIRKRWPSGEKCGCGGISARGRLVVGWRPIIQDVDVLTGSQSLYSPATVDQLRENVLRPFLV
jgi:hypothetical protein